MIKGFPSSSLNTIYKKEKKMAFTKTYYMNALSTEEKQRILTIRYVIWILFTARTQEQKSPEIKAYKFKILLKETTFRKHLLV